MKKNYASNYLQKIIAKATETSHVHEFKRQPSDNNRLLAKRVGVGTINCLFL
jgi:hypothetical protein